MDAHFELSYILKKYQRISTHSLSSHMHIVIAIWINNVCFLFDVEVIMMLIGIGWYMEILT